MLRTCGAVGLGLALAIAVGCGSSDPARSSGSGGAGGGGGAGGAFVAMPTTSNVFVSELDPAGCLPRPLARTDAGAVFCEVVEASASGACNCDAPGRSAVGDAELHAVQFMFGQSGACAVDSSGRCSSVCGCRIDEETGAAKRACLADPVAAGSNPSVPPGFCYVDDPSLPTLAACPVNQKQRLLFVSPSQSPTPAPGTQLFVACRGAAVTP